MTNENNLQQLGDLLQERELASLVAGLRLVLCNGRGWGRVEVNIKNGHIDLVTPTISIKPDKEQCDDGK